MLFDLQSPRRRNFIRVIYASLAILMAGGLLLFGIGGEVSGGLLDGLGVGGGGSGSASFEEEIEDAEAAVAANPRDEAAVLELARVHFLAGSAVAEEDPETGTRIPTEDSQQEFAKAADAWDQYLKLKPKQLNPEVAALMSQAFVSLAESATTANEALNNIKDAAAAQEILATAQPSLGTYSNLALYQYFAGDTTAADQSAKQAEELAQGGQKQQLLDQLEQFKKTAA